MKGFISLYSITLSLCFVSYSALAVIDPGAETVKVSKTCMENGATINNCFTKITDLTSWMANTRTPGEADPLRVEIGPGTFKSITPRGGVGTVPALTLNCDGVDYTGYTSFVGAGNGQTILSTNSSSQAPIDVSWCTNLSFSDMTVNGPGYGGVTWSGGGDSKWINVDVNAVARGWYEPGCGTSRGNHYWYSSKITTTPAYAVTIGYRATCDESWFFGSEVTAIVPAGTSSTGSGALVAYDQGIIHAYGSVLRAFADSSSDLPAARAANSGQIHIHGTGIDVISSTGEDIMAFHVSSGGHIHANETAYNMQTAGGTISRIVNLGGMVSAPFIWKQSAEAPVITSEHGADMVVVTNTADGQPHLVIYSDNCTSQWFDTTTAACR